jgi:ribosomal protein S18 acetylase RimI-like enzyme
MARAHGAGPWRRAVLSLSRATGQTVPVPAIRKATLADVPQLAAVLARAFDDDPVAVWNFPDPARRRRALPRFFEAQLRHVYLRDDLVYTTEDVRGGALWSPPGKPPPGLRDIVRLLPLVPLVGRQLPRALGSLRVLEAKHPKVPHHYLAVLGTDPDFQGRGIGSALLAPVLERCDTEGTPAYLESSKERNVPFYARHGFEVTEVVQLPRGGPRIWLMWRNPRG